MIQVFRDSGFPAQVRARAGRARRRNADRESTTQARGAFEERDRIAAVAAVAHFLEPASVAVIGASAAPRLRRRRAHARTCARASRGRSSRSAAGSRSSISTRPVELAVIAVPADAVEARRARVRRARASRRCSSSRPASRTPRARSAGAGSPRSAVRPACAWSGRTASASRRPRLNATFARSRPMRGRVALLSQSGGVGIAALEQRRGHGIGLSSFVSIGDRADISSNDLLQWWEQDDGTRRDRALSGVLRQPPAVRADRAARRTRRSRSSRSRRAARAPASRAAGSHTGALVGGIRRDRRRAVRPGRRDPHRQLPRAARRRRTARGPAGSRGAAPRRRDQRRRAGDPAAPTRPTRPGSSCPSRRAATARALRAVLPDSIAPGNPVDVLGDATRRAAARRDCGAGRGPGHRCPRGRVRADAAARPGRRGGGDRGGGSTAWTAG